MLRENGRLIMPLGVMGGAYHPNGHARFVSNLCDFDMEMQAALDAPCLFMDGDQTKLERGYSDAVRQKLIDFGRK